MVRAFVLHTLGGPAPAAAPGPAAAATAAAPPPPPRCRVLYARAFGAPAEGPPGRQRLRRKEQLLVLSRQVDSQCRLLQAAAGRAAAPTLPQLPDEPVSLQAAPGGLFRLPAGDPFAEPATVVWLAVLALGFALVCDPHENLPLAESTLRRLAQRLLGSLRLLSPGSAALLRADSAEALLDRFLPHGQLLFLNEPFVQALDRELGARAAR
ncbi:LOW QUALITY PROTEIN: AP-5 complex subunit sigma-1 [Apteryx mantelli]|uniref:LOW QUALITY PROTEIN: AP-5 complex subunit sigma-1 n=1 Tax=Apteryx mantelli TaxID=2696672 RepID=A0ABM4EKZ2_9AVES